MRLSLSGILPLIVGTLSCAQTKPANIAITPADIAMANSVIQKNTMSLPGLTPGSRSQAGPGPFSAADALVLYALKLHVQTKVCVPPPVFGKSLDRIKDADVHKKAALGFWADYCGASDIDASAAKPGALRNGFDWYTTAKTAERLKRSNRVLEGQVRSEEAWRRAMDSDRKFQQKVRAAEERNRTARDAYLTQWNAEAAVAAAERAVASNR